MQGPRNAVSHAICQTLAGLAVLALELVDELGDGQHSLDAADAVSSAPNLAPRFRWIELFAEIDALSVRRQIVRVEPGGADRGAQKVGVHAADLFGVHDVGAATDDDHAFVVLVDVGLVGGQKARAHVREIGAARTHGGNVAAVADAAGEQNGAVEERSDLGDERKRIDGAGVSTSASRDQHESIDTSLGGLASMTNIDDIMKHHASDAGKNEGK
jgi:hypothetical protein